MWRLADDVRFIPAMLFGPVQVPDRHRCGHRGDHTGLPVSCSRLAHHPGRHVEHNGRVTLAAWPGDHRPTIDDVGRTPRSLVGRYLRLVVLLATARRHRLPRGGGQ